MAPDGGIFVSEEGNHRVMHWPPGADAGINVAGGYGAGPENHQLSQPCGLATAPDGGVFVADRGNHRVMHWAPGDVAGTVVAGGHGQGEEHHQLSGPCGVAMAPDGGVFVGDTLNNRVMHWAPKASNPDLTFRAFHSFGNWIWSVWKPAVHHRWDLDNRRTVEQVLLCQRRGSHSGLTALGNLLVTEVIPFVIPLRLLFQPIQTSGVTALLWHRDPTTKSFDLSYSCYRYI